MALVSSGSVGVPVFTGRVPQPVPDPSPGVNSVLYDGTMGPTPSPDDRLQHSGGGYLDQWLKP